MVDWLVSWGVTNVVGFVFKPILEDLAKDAAKDFVKDFFKDSLKHVFLREKDPRQIATGKAIKEFLQLVHQELKFRKITEADIKQYTTPLGKFIRDKSVKEILGKAFDADCETLDTETLANTWYKLELPDLPPKFNWQAITEQYVRKVQEIRTESKELRDILDSQNLEAIQQNTQELAGIIPEFDLSGYQEGIIKRYGNLNLQSLDTSGYAYNELKLWSIFIRQNVREVNEVLPQIHEIPKEHQQRLRESNQLEAEISLEELERHQQVYYQQPIRPAVDIANDKQSYNYAVILGDPGSGKSTLLQFIALNWARTPINNVISLPIPLLIELRTYMRNRDEQQCKNFLDFFHQGSGAICHLNQHQLHEQLKAGNAIVMFDGLDEVFDPGKREDVIADIIRFTNEYPNVQVLVTSRVIGYKQQRLRDAQFSHFMLQDLEPEQIKDFINRWHELTFKDDVDKVRKKERLQRAIDTSKAIEELAGNPLLLTMMAILNRNQELPRDRPELYNQASRVLLHQWDVERALIEDERLDPKTIDYKDKQAMLRQVAYHMQANTQSLAGNLISATDLEKILTDYLKTIENAQARAVAKLMIEQLRTRNFILCFLGADYYAFVHRTFLEYFCAWEFVWQFEKEQKISIEEIKTEVFGKHWRDESWHEVLRLIAGMLDTKFAGKIIDYLIEQNGEAEKFTNLFLAAECLVEVRNRNAIALTANKLLNDLKTLTKYDIHYYYKSYEEEAMLVRKIRTQAIAAVATTWKEHPDTLPLLKQLADSDQDEYVRGAAVQELAKGWKEHPDTLPLLKQLADSDQDEYVRGAAVQELARGWKEHPDTLPLLKQLADSDQHEDVRGAAVQELARGWKEHPDTLPLLKQLAHFDQHEDVRSAAVQELARGWKEHPDTLPLLKQLVHFDQHEDVRSAAVQELARGWKDEPGRFEFLCDRALNDPFQRENSYQYNPRQIALEAIFRQYPNHPQSVALLRDRAENDSDEKLRKFAQKKLAELEISK